MTGIDGGLDDPERALLAELAARHGLGSSDDARAVARGAENTTFAIGEWIVRRSDDLDSVAREVALLRRLARATRVPVPVPVVHEVDAGIMVYRRLPGEPLLARRRAVDVGRALIDVLGTLRRIHADLPFDDVPIEEWHDEAVRHFGVVRPHLDAAQAATVAAFLESPPPPPGVRVVALHNDLGAEHILADAGGRVTGVIDWTDAARADPARDLGTIFRDLGPSIARQVGEALEGPLTDGDLARMRFHGRCTWLEDLEFAISDLDGRTAYRTNAWATFDRTFRDP
ncbi:aminoglycoside phosphotransferase family protein [Agromyces sp. NPDC056523]|uniref:aminoglycoside phosphotransferase family protein n=1 Tax=Agromyces sp. NPDC056523 TaxID=3345850 RepID=UPI00366C14C4